jgi:fatty acid amide hydrolase
MSQTAKDELTRLSASELARLIASRSVSATESVEAHLELIQVTDDRLHAIVVPLYEQALAEAAQADRDGAGGRPMHGVPVTIKECVDVAGTPSTVGLESRRSVLAGKDAELVRRLRAAGAIVVGKTNVPQFLLYSESDNPVYGRTNNPWNLGRSPGGSSGGEGAAVAAGYSSLGLGTDIGGSVRIPAHFCGVHSLKPTPDRLTLSGTADEGLFRTVRVPDAAGPLARSVEDLRLAMSALGSPVAEVGVDNLRIGFYDDNRIFPASAAIRRAIREAADALEDTGCGVEEIEPPDISTALRLFYGFVSAGADHFKAELKGSPGDPRVKELLLLAGLPNLLRPPMAGLYDLQGQHHVARVIRWARRMSAGELAALESEWDAFRSQTLNSLGKVDAVLCPTSAFPAIPHGASKDVDLATFSYTSPFNVLAWPAGSVAVTRVRPDEEAGRSAARDRVDDTARRTDVGSTGLPVGVQVAARPGRDELVLAVMQALESHFRTTPDYPITPVAVQAT